MDILKIYVEAPILLVKPCDLLTGELMNQPQLLQTKDFADMVRQIEAFDLLKIVPRDEINKAETDFWPGMVGSTMRGVLNSYPPVEQSVVPGVIIGNPTMLVAPSVYVHPWLPAWEAIENYPYATGGNNERDNLDPQRYISFIHTHKKKLSGQAQLLYFIFANLLFFLKSDK